MDGLKVKHVKHVPFQLQGNDGGLNCRSKCRLNMSNMPAAPQCVSVTSAECSDGPAGGPLGRLLAPPRRCGDGNYS